LDRLFGPEEENRMKNEVSVQQCFCPQETPPPVFPASGVFFSAGRLRAACQRSDSKTQTDNQLSPMPRGPIPQSASQKNQAGANKNHDSFGHRLGADGGNPIEAWSTT
jgi:hypothetical protein